MIDLDALKEEMPRHPLWPKFQEWMGENRHVYDYATEFAREYRDAGHKRISIHLLIERVRWEVTVVRMTGKPTEEFMIPNGYKPLIARLIALFEPDLRDMFEFRALTSIEDEAA